MSFTGSAYAHHSFAAQYDINQRVHTYFCLDVADGTGKVTNIAYSATIEDPVALIRPYTTGLRLDRKANDVDRVREYECSENNQNLPHIIGAERASQ